jgi:hypothetical protein
MTNSAPTNSRTKLSRILNLFVEDLDSVPDDHMSDEEVGAMAKRMLSVAEGETTKISLQAAKEEVAAFWSKVERRLGQSTGDPRARLEQLLEQRPDLLDNLTFAARNGKEWDEEDLRQIVEDLEILEELNRRNEDQ